MGEATKLSELNNQGGPLLGCKYLHKTLTVLDKTNFDFFVVIQK